MNFKNRIISILKLNSNKINNFNTRIFAKVFIVSFLFCFIILFVSFFSQYKNVFLSELNNSLNDIYVSSNNTNELKSSIEWLLNSYNIKYVLWSENQVCKSNDQILINEKILNVCFNKKELNYNLTLSKDYSFVIKELLFSIPYIILISLISLFFLYLSNSKIFRKVTYFLVERDKIFYFVNSSINDINNMLLNYTLSNFDNSLNKLYDYSVMFLDLSPDNLHLIESKLRKLIETARALYLDEYANQIYLLSKEIEIYYFKLKKDKKSLFSSYFLMITSRYYTSKLQLWMFILFFALINTFYLKTLYEIPRFINNSFLFYLSEVFSILSNLWWSISFSTDIEYLYNIILQLIWVVFFGLLLWIITKEIK